MELLHGVEEVHEEGDQTDPEGRHGHKNKPLANRLLSVVRCGEHDTDKSYKVDNLQHQYVSVKSSSLTQKMVLILTFQIQLFFMTFSFNEIVDIEEWRPSQCY